MSFFNIALNNIKKKFSSYLIYFLSTIFSVTVFNIFCSIYFNPQFSGYRFGSGKISVLFQASAIAVILFSAIFILYSNNSFLKTRKKEIAIYSLLGMRKKQIGRMMFYENMLMGLLATVCGVLLGMVFSRFFTMILLNLMADGTNVSFSISVEATVVTVIAFVILFIITSLNSYRIIYRFRLIELLSASKEAEKLPKYSAAGGIVGIVLIALGYYISMVMNVNEGALKLLLPACATLFLVVVGTLLFFQNFIPMIAIKLKNNTGYYYKTENVISISQIVYRIKANSKVLSIIAISCAAAIALMSITYSMYRGLESTVDYYSPFSYMSKNATDQQFNEMLSTVKQVDEVNVVATNRFKLIKMQGQNKDYSIEKENKPGMSFKGYILSQNDYKSIIKNTSTQTGSFSNVKTDFNMDLKDNECYFIDGNTTDEYCKNLIGSKLNVTFLNCESSFDIAGVSMHKYIGLFDLYKVPTIVLSDNNYNMFLKQANADSIVSYTGLMFDKPSASENTVNALNKIIPKNEEISATGLPNISFIGFYKSAFSLYGAYVFICMFIGILFLLTSGSIMYYKQIMEAQEEAERYDILKKTGMSKNEAKKSISKQLAIVFGASLAVGFLHSVFVLQIYNRSMDLLGKDPATMLNAFLIVAIYIIIYFFFYVLSRKSYMQIVWGKEK